MSDLFGQTTRDRVAELLALDGVSDGVDYEFLTLDELDSLLILELLAIVEESVGHQVSSEAFPPSLTSVADVLRFAELNGTKG